MSASTPEPDAKNTSDAPQNGADAPEPATEAPSALSPAEQIESLTERLKKAERQVALIRQAHTEAAAEFEKTRDRLRRNHSEELERAKQAMTRSLFDVADNLDRTIEGVKMGGDLSSLLEGVSAVKGQFLQTLGEFGLERFDPMNRPFDPEQHDAIGVLPVVDPHLDNAVVAVLKPGFRAGDTVLRPALVQVGKYQAPPDDDATPTTDE